MTDCPIVKSGAKSKFLAALYDAADVLAAVIAMIAILLVFFVRAAAVDGHSMEPTLHDKDRLLVTAFLAAPRRGQIVIISPERNEHHKPLVKRVIAVGGDKVDIFNGGVFVNDHKLDETYLPEGTVTNVGDLFPSGGDYPFTVPAGHCFVMGDNRGVSSDSRFQAVGFVGQNDLIGRVLFRFWPR
ncbi:MAG: signal peptidase I [Oscillospiraceae bacterium]|jgi:signal peptidase I|nr:signal peptidase I [Oscillospiraceae bacterium]